MISTMKVMIAASSIASIGAIQVSLKPLWGRKTKSTPKPSSEKTSEEVAMENYRRYLARQQKPKMEFTKKLQEFVKNDDRFLKGDLQEGDEETQQEIGLANGIWEYKDGEEVTLKGYEGEQAGLNGLKGTLLNKHPKYATNFQKWHAVFDATNQEIPQDMQYAIRNGKVKFSVFDITMEYTKEEQKAAHDVIVELDDGTIDIEGLTMKSCMQAGYDADDYEI